MARVACLVVLYGNSGITIADMDDRRFGKASITQQHWLAEVESCQAQPNYYAPNSSQLGGMQRSQVD